MNQNYIKPQPWSIVEEGFDPARVKSSESLFSLGNGAMGQRANFEESYSGSTFQGSYIAGVYYPDKTKVGWWKNGYPEYFAKVLNAPNWIGINVKVNEEVLDLNTCESVTGFKRELNMKEGWLSRSFEAKLKNGITIAVQVKRFLSLSHDEVGAISFAVTPINQSARITFSPYLDGGIVNEDSNWDDMFWDISSVKEINGKAFISARTMKTDFHTCTFMSNQCFLDSNPLALEHNSTKTEKDIVFDYQHHVEKMQTYTIHKFGGYTVDRYHDKNDLVTAADQVLSKVLTLGYDALLNQQIKDWKSIWDMSDITIDGDVEAQQGIRFNIFQLNQTYLGRDTSLNIGPKGFTGEKYGGSTYWDTEAYCLPFYMSTKNKEVAKALLEYRYQQLDKAIENAEKLGFSGGAALYPMVTMNGEECHNEWEITFEEIHRNGAIAFAIFNYHRYTGDYSYTLNHGIEVLFAIARFWQQRASFSRYHSKYVILGVTGPNEYENNVNNNFYTNYIAKWCIEYALEQLNVIHSDYPSNYSTIIEKLNTSDEELNAMKAVASGMYFPYSEEHGVYLQQDGFLDKELEPVDNLSSTQRPINQFWSWDRILRSVYIKQADVLQGFYFFEDHFSNEELAKHFDFYEPFTVHESSLSPCVHSIQAAKLNRMDQAYAFYLRTSRLDLDDYNKEVEEGLHITSMAGTWMSIVEGFGGMRIVDNQLHFNTRIPDNWKSYTFKVNFRDQIVKVTVSHNGADFELTGTSSITLFNHGELFNLQPKSNVYA